jgi:predicted component of type VI protein secretion system
MRLEAFLAKFRSTIIVLSGEATGMEFVLDARRSLIGRGPGVDLALDDPSLAREHAAIEFAPDGFHLHARAAGASIAINGAPASATPLKPGDRFQLGEIQFGFEIEARE